MGAPEKDNSPVGEPEQGERPVGEPEKDDSPVDCCPGERPSHGWLGPVPKRSRECKAQGSSRRTPKPRVNRSTAKGPVDPLPGERACHGRHAPGFRAKQDSESEERLGPVPKRSRECAAEGIVPANARATDGSGRYPSAAENAKRRGEAQQGKPRSFKR